MGEMGLFHLLFQFFEQIHFSWYVIMSSLRDFENIILRFL